MLGAHMDSEIRAQPRLLLANADDYYTSAFNALHGKRFDLAVLAARGSSDNAALFARYLIEIHLGIPVVLAAPSVFTRYGATVRYPNSLVIGISQSGAAPDVAEVLAVLGEQGLTTLGITNTLGSRLDRTAKHTLPLNVGVEQSVAATKTYTASLLALYQVVRALGGHLPDPKQALPGEAWLGLCDAVAADDAPRLAGATSVFPLARGYSYCSAMETALKLMECALIPAKAFSWADFQHGPTALAVEGSAAIAFGAVGEGLEERGCRVLRAPDSDGSEELRPVMDIFYGQFLALHAARNARFDPDKPPNLRKVTETT
ncbi:MAG: SIS domain-containing protein [Fimbriimonadaceae bacterium]